MESIAVTKPNMTVARQDVLSPFGFLTELFLTEIARRNSRSPGFYRMMPLAYLEESEREALPAPPEIRVELNMDLFWNRLRKETQEREKNEKKPQTPQERIIERVIVRERELRMAYAETRRVVVETGGKRFLARVPVTASEQGTEPAAKSTERQTLRVKEVSNPKAADASRPAASPSRLLSAVGTAKPVQIWIAAENKPVNRTLPLASQMMSAPAAGGWTPQQRELHPGYPVRSETKQAKDAAVGSILLPDVLRRRREEAIAQSEHQKAVVDAAEDYGTFLDALAWSTDGTEQVPETERVLREVRRAVDETLRRNALHKDAAFAQSDRRGERETVPVGANGTESQKESSNFSTRARAHAHEAQSGQITGSAPHAAMSTGAAETAQKAEPAEAESAGSSRVFSEREAAAAPEPVLRSSVFRTEAAVREAAVPIPGVPTGEEPNLPAELTFREEAKQPEAASAEQKIFRQPARKVAAGTTATKPAQAQATAAAPAAVPSQIVETEIPVERVFREDSAEPKAQGTAKTDRSAPVPRTVTVTKEPAQFIVLPAKQPAPQIASGAERAEAAQPEMEGNTAIPATTLETELPAELTFRAEAEQIDDKPAAQRDAKQSAPQGAGRTEAAKPVKPETAAHTAIPSASAAAEEPAARTFRAEAEQPETRREPAESEAETPTTAIPAAQAEAGEPAALTFRAEAEQPGMQPALQREATKTAPQTTVGTEAGNAEQAKPEAATRVAIPSAEAETARQAAIPTAYAETGSSAELTYRAESEQPGMRMGTAEHEAALPAAIPTEDAVNGEPTKLVFRKESEQPGIQPEGPKDTKQPAQQTAIGIEAGKAVQTQPEKAARAAIPSAETGTEIPAERTCRTPEETVRRSAEGTDVPVGEPAEQRSKVPTPVPVQPETAAQTAIPLEDSETEMSAELTYRAEAEQIHFEPAGQRDTNRPAKQTAVGTQAIKAAKPEAATRAAIPSGTPETDRFGERIYRAKAEQPKPDTAGQRETKQPLRQTADGEEAEKAAQAQPETAAQTAIPFAETGTELPAELTYRADSKETVQRSTDGTGVPRYKPAERRTDVRMQVAEQPEAAIRAAIPSAETGTEVPAELAYRQKAEQAKPDPVGQRDLRQPAPQIADGEEAINAMPAQPETAATAVPSEDTETEIPAELTYRAEPGETVRHRASRQTDGATRIQTAAQQLGKTIRTQKGTRQTGRDIRVTSELGRRHADPARSERRNAEQGEQGTQTTQIADRIALPVGEETDPQTNPELFFAAPAAIGQPPEDPTAARSAKSSQSDQTSELPTWAKELLEKSGVSQAEQRSAAFNWDAGSLRSNAVNWTAPTTAPQSIPNGRTELTFKEPREPEEGFPRQTIDDAEIQRTADKVYKLIEERLRRELRRSGR